MERLMPQSAGSSMTSRGPVLLSVCLDIDRMESREHALHEAGYLVASASTVTAASEMSQLCKFDIVLLDYECASDDRACHLLERYPSIFLDAGTTEKELLARVGQASQATGSSAAVA